MGLYDDFVDRGHSAQVKVYDDRCLRSFRRGDEVPSLSGSRPPDTYSVALECCEGRHGNVSEGVFVGITKRPKFKPVIDKWGNPVA